MRCSGSARAVSIRIGTRDSFWSERANSMPDSCGIITSRMSRSKDRLRAHRCPRACGVDRGRDAEAVILEVACEQVADAAVVVDDENVRGVVVGAAAAGLDRCRHGHHPRRPSLSGAGDAAMMEETLGRSSALTMARKRRKCASVPGPAASTPPRAAPIAAPPAARRGPVLFSREQKALAAIGASRPLHDVALVDQLLEHAGEALLGDGEDVEQVGDAQARMAIDEMQHAMMRPAEAEILEDRVGVAGEIAIGEEQQLGEFEQLGLGQAAFARAAIAARLGARGLARGALLPRATVSVRSVMLT